MKTRGEWVWVPFMLTTEARNYTLKQHGFDPSRVTVVLWQDVSNKRCSIMKGWSQTDLGWIPRSLWPSLTLGFFMILSSRWLTLKQIPALLPLSKYMTFGKLYNLSVSQTLFKSNCFRFFKGLRWYNAWKAFSEHLEHSKCPVKCTCYIVLNVARFSLLKNLLLEFLTLL